MRRRIIVLLVMASNHSISPFMIIQRNSERRIANHGTSSSYNKKQRHNSHLRMTALPSIEAMRTIEIRQELESYGIPARSSWGSQELATALRQVRIETAEKRRLAKKKTKNNERVADIDNVAVPEAEYDPSTVEVDQPAFIDVEHVPDDELPKQVLEQRKRRPIIARIGGFLSRRKKGKQGKRPVTKHIESADRQIEPLKKKAKPTIEPAATNNNTMDELPFFLEFLEEEEADTGPISVEVVRLRTETRYTDDDDDANSGPRKRLLYTRGLGRSRRSKKTKADAKVVIKPMGQHYETTPNFIDTYSRGERRIEYQHHFQVIQDDESTTHKLQQGDPTLQNSTVIDVPAKHIHFDYRDPDHFSNLRCDDWDGFAA